MASLNLIDEDSNGRDNEIVKKIVRAYKLTPNKFWIGDTVYYTQVTRGKVIDKYGLGFWDDRCEVFKLQPMTPMKIVAINKHNEGTSPWWYMAKAENIREPIWFVEDGLVPATPNYTPRKMDRTTESSLLESVEFKRYKYRDIVVKVENEDDVEELQDNIKSITRLENDLGKQIAMFPNYIYIDVNDAHDRGTAHIYYMSDRIDDEAIQRYLYDDPRVNQHIFELSEWNTVKHIMLYGVEEVVPNYKPRKMDRTLEAKNSISEAEEIMILIRNMDELNTFYEAIKPLGYVIIDVFFKVLKEHDSPINIFIHLKTGDISQSTQMKDYPDWTKNSTFDGVWEKELTIEDLPLIKKILQTGKVSVAPSYKPRNIKKIDESVIYDFDHIPPSILTPAQQELQYKVGDTVIIRPDAFQYFDDVNESMESWLGEKGEIIYVVKAEDIYGTYTNRGKGMKPDDLLLTLKLEGSEDGDDTFYWFYRCLINPDFFGPSYKPRKMDRTLEAKESFRDDYHIDSEKYQDKFGKVSPPLIPIEEIEQFYNVKFEDYCNDLYPQLNESPDWASWFGTKGKEVLTWDKPGAYAFGYYNGVMYVSPESKGHGSMGSEDDRRYTMFDRTLFQFPGRIWTIQKLMSFWIYPNKEDFKKLLQDLSEVTKIDFSDSKWQIEILDTFGKSKNIPLSEYMGSENVSREELIKQHVVSPLLKPKREVPYGYGSKNPSYQKKRVWDMASLTTETKTNKDT